MLIEIDLNSSQPIFEQVSRQIMFAIASGAVRSGELVPSVRELARQLAINPNTVARAYRDLQDDGILTLRRGMGLAVAENAEPECLERRRRFFEQKFRNFLDEAARSRLTSEELDEILQQPFSRAAQAPASPEKNP